MALLKVENLEAASAARVAWTAAPANYDIGANDPLKLNVPGLSNPSEGRPCRRVTCGVAGNLVYVGLDGVTVTLPTLAGQSWDIQMSSLTNASTVQNVVVQW